MSNSLHSRHLDAAMGRGLVYLANWRLYRSVERLYELEPRIVYELLPELGASMLSRAEIERVRRYIIGFCPPEARR